MHLEQTGSEPTQQEWSQEPFPSGQALCFLGWNRSDCVVPPAGKGMDVSSAALWSDFTHLHKLNLILVSISSRLRNLLASLVGSMDL